WFVAQCGVPEEPSKLGNIAVAMVAEQLGAAGFPACRYLDTLLGVELLRRCRPSGALGALLRDTVEGRHGVAVAYRDAGNDRAPDRLPQWPRTPGGDSSLLLSARRSFVVSADEADTLLLLGAGRPGVALLPTSSPSLLLEGRSTMGQRRLFDIDLSHARISGSDLLEFGFDGDPAVVWTGVLARARVWQAAYLTGLASGALDLAVQYARSRRQFGKPLARFQSISFRLAAGSARVHATRLLVRDVALSADAGADVAVPAARALALASEVSRAVTAESVHIHGAFGMTLQSAAQRFLRDVGVESVWLGVVPELRAANKG
ncbi:acyl-CoA dehydrogenase family protein, partial [Streptomyces sp900116325]|uniref:acyl-CoA dehydrogenase family protein n=1 Tax=Streptomyces sp. 900116325 TaxID=3154295 RepID=UPI0034026410